MTRLRRREAADVVVERDPSWRCLVGEQRAVPAHNGENTTTPSRRGRVIHEKPLGLPTDGSKALGLASLTKV